MCSPPRAGSTFLKMTKAMCMLIAIKGKFVKIENVLPTEGGKHFFEGVMLDLHVRCEFLKMIENRKCAPHLRREYEFCKFHNRTKIRPQQLFCISLGECRAK